MSFQEDRPEQLRSAQQRSASKPHHREPELSFRGQKSRSRSRDNNRDEKRDENSPTDRLQTGVKRSREEEEVLTLSPPTNAAAGQTVGPQFSTGQKKLRVDAPPGGCTSARSPSDG